MTFRLVKGFQVTNLTLSASENPNDLDYSDLHDCDTWSIWLGALCVAGVNWMPYPLYRVGNKFGGMEILVPHERIIPTIKGILNYNWLFGITKSCYCYPIVE
jgi:hypothetical protein